jgi:hypothetical protein
LLCWEWWRVGRCVAIAAEKAISMTVLPNTTLRAVKLFNYLPRISVKMR